MVTFVNSGLEYDAKLFNGESTAPFKYVAMGSGSTAEANDQEALVTEITDTGLARAEGTTSYEASYISVVTHEFTATGTTTFRECGLFDASESGHMAMRHLFSSDKNIDNGEQAEITFKVTKARA